MTALTLLRTQPTLPYAPKWSLADGSMWPNDWSMRGDSSGAATLWDFSSGQGTWTVGPNWTLAAQAANTHSVGGALSLTRNSATPGSGYVLNASTTILSGAKHVLSFWVYANTPTVYSVKIVPKTSGNVPVGPSLTFDYVPKVGVWYKQTIYFTAPAATLADIYLTDDGNLSPQVGSVIIIDDIELVSYVSVVDQFSNEGRMLPGTGAFNQIRMDLANGPVLDNAMVLVDLQTDTTKPVRAVIGINGNASGMTGYQALSYSLAIDFGVGAAGTAQLTFYSSYSGINTVVGTPVTISTLGATWSRIKFKRYGRVLSAQVWDASAADPQTWAMTTTLAETVPLTGQASLGYVGGQVGSQNPYFYWRNFSYDQSVADSGGTGGGTGGTGGTATTPTQVGTAQSAGSATNSVTVNAPAGIVSGNLLVAVLSFNTDATIPAQAGWTQATQVGNAAGALLGIFYKIAGASEPSTYTFSGTASTSSAAIVSAYTSFDTTTPFDITPSSVTATGTSITLGPVTTVTDKALVLYGSAARSASDTIVVDPALTSSTVGTVQRRIAMATETISPAGTTVGRTFSGTTSVPRSGIVVAIRPYVAAGSGSTVIGNIKYYNGTSFVAKFAKVWNGAAWVIKPVKRWDGTQWVVMSYSTTTSTLLQLNPNTATGLSGTVTGASTNDLGPTSVDGVYSLSSNSRLTETTTSGLYNLGA